MSHEEPAKPADSSRITEVSSAPERCLGGCGFFGRADTAGYCSVCYQKIAPKTESDATPASSSDSADAAMSAMAAESTDADTDAIMGSASATSAAGADSAAASSSASAMSEVDDGGRPIQKKKHRCWECKKKIKPAGRFSCKCGYTFCGKHRYADAHSCDFDYHKEHTEKLAKLNPEVGPSKMEDRI